MRFLRIKWENIIALAVGIFFVYCIIKHMVINGLVLNVLIQEIIVYGLATLIAYYSFLIIRKLFLEK